jgi:hypothetical protein
VSSKSSGDKEQEKKVSFGLIFFCCFQDMLSRLEQSVSCAAFGSLEQAANWLDVEVFKSKGVTSVQLPRIV